MENEPRRSRSEIFKETEQDMEALFAHHNARIEAGHQRVLDTANETSRRIENATNQGNETS